jgi:hypothetical protein
MPPWSPYVRYWMNSGKHMLMASFSGFAEADIGPNRKRGTF